MNALLRLFGYEIRKDEGPNNVALALCNGFTAYPGCKDPTTVSITHAQCINARGLVRIFISDGRQYTAQIQVLDG